MSAPILRSCGCRAETLLDDIVRIHHRRSARVGAEGSNAPAPSPSPYGRSGGTGTLRVAVYAASSGMKGFVDATRIRDGAGAGSPWRNVAINMLSSEPSSGAVPTYSTRTGATPLP